MEAWIQDNELQAYGLCGLTPEQFGSLTVPEFASMVEAARWREARWVKFAAGMVVQLLSPHLRKGTDLQAMLNRMLGGNTEVLIIEARRRRLAGRKEETD